MRDSYFLYKDKLHSEYKETFEKIELYVMAQNIDSFSREERLAELLDIFLTAQGDSKPINKIIGKDLEDFCKTFCSDLGIKSKFAEFLSSLKNIVIFEFFISLLDLVPAPDDTASFWERKADSDIFVFVTIILLSLTVGYLTNFLLCKLMFKYRKLNIKLLKTLSVLSGCACVVISFLLISSRKVPILSCPVWLSPLLCILYLVFYYTFNSKKIRERKREKISVIDAANEQYPIDFDKMMQKRFDKLNKRNARKRIEELSFSEFLRIQEDDCKKTDKMRWLYFLSPLPITAMFYFSSDFETTFDRIIFIILLLGVQYFAVNFAWKITKNQNEQTKKWIAKKRNEFNL